LAESLVVQAGARRSAAVESARSSSGPVLFLGSSAQFIAGPPYGTGPLSLGINDGILDDNSGVWSMVITVPDTAPPPPGPPDTRLTRCEYLWQQAARLRSTNLGTLQEYVEQRRR
jgi:hypothetical protein